MLFAFKNGLLFLLSSSDLWRLKRGRFYKIVWFFIGRDGTTECLGYIYVNVRYPEIKFYYKCLDNGQCGLILSADLARVNAETYVCWF